VVGKRVVFILIVLLICVGLLVIGCGPSEEEKQRAWQDIEHQQHEEVKQLDREILFEQVKYVRLKFGDVAASTYELCHTYPPQEKANQKKCADLDERVKRAQAHDPKW